MSKENPIDKQFREGLAKREYAFDTAYWEAAEQSILSQQNRKKKRLLYTFSYVIALLTVIAIPVLVLTLSDVPSATSEPSLSALTYQPLISENKEQESENKEQESTIGNETQEPANRESANREPKNLPTNLTSAIVGPLTDRQTSTQSPTNPSLQPDPESGTGEGMGTAFPDEERVSLDKLPFLNALSSLQRLSDRRFSFHAGLNSATPARYPVAGRPMAHHHLYLQIGAAIIPSWTDPQQGTSRVNSHPAINIRYAYSLSPHLNLYTGLGYQGRGGLNTDTLINRQEFGFGVVGETVEISQQRLHQLEIPLGLELRLGGRHSLLAGFSATYLLNSSSQETRTSYSSLGGGPVQLTQDVWGYKEGFRQWDTHLQVGYAVYLNGGIRTGLLVNYGLNDLTDDAYFGRQALNRNTQIRWFVDLYLSHL